MEIIHVSAFSTSTEAIEMTPQVLAIGDFDGLHLGHQEVLNRARRTARKLGCLASVMTFHPHPREILGQGVYAHSLTPLEDKLELLASLGMERAYVVQFDSSFAAMPPERFVDSVLLPLGVETVVVGFDFTFGHRGVGTADTLSLQAKGRFTVEVVRPFHLDGDKVSSTLIRECLQAGHVDKVTHLLGRPYALRGDVVTGEGRGRTIGIPTANLSLTESYVVPSRGVYAIQAIVDGERFNGVMNIGLKPTFNGLTETMESHLFDFSQDIYGKRIVIELIHFIRNERKFGSAAELVDQIRQDMQEARTILPRLS